MRLASTLLGCALLAACSSSATPDGPQCANESKAVPFSDAGVLPLRALPTGVPCAEGAECSATIDDCPNDWPASASAPETSNATPFQCTCPNGVWACVSTATSAGSCAVTGADAGATDGGTD